MVIMPYVLTTVGAYLEAFHGLFDHLPIKVCFDL